MSSITAVFTIVGAFANGDILQVLMFSVLFGFALHRLGAYGKPILDFIDRFAHVMFNIINMIMKLAPLGALGAMAFTIGAYGVGSLVQLGGAQFFWAALIASSARFCGRSSYPWKERVNEPVPCESPRRSMA